MKKKLAYIFASGFLLAGCESILDNITRPKEVQREFHQNHQDPRRMTDKIDNDRAIQNNQDIERQERKEQDAKNQQLDKVIDRSLGR